MNLLRETLQGSIIPSGWEGPLYAGDVGGNHHIQFKKAISPELDKFLALNVFPALKDQKNFWATDREASIQYAYGATTLEPFIIAFRITTPSEGYHAKIATFGSSVSIFVAISYDAYDDGSAPYEPDEDQEEIVPEPELPADQRYWHRLQPVYDLIKEYL